MAKLSEAQRTALYVMPFDFSTWGGKPFGGLPGGVHSVATLWALHKKGLATVRYDGLRQHWSATPAGRQALQEQGR